jgi:hypothetical protein
MMHPFRGEKEEDRAQQLIHGREDTHPKKILNFTLEGCINN